MARDTIVAITLLLAASNIAAAQKLVPQQPLTVTVVNAHADPAQPVQAVRVSLGYVDGSVHITEGTGNVTNRDGEVQLQVSTDAAQRDGLRIEVSGASGLVIYQPADGQLPALPKAIKVSLLPKGSPALLGPAQIEATLRRALAQVSSLQKENRALKQQAANTPVVPPQKQDLSAALADLAQSSGFQTADVEARVQQWGHDTEQKATTATCQQKGLAQLALTRNDAAAAQFTACYTAELESVRKLPVPVPVPVSAPAPAPTRSRPRPGRPVVPPAPPPPPPPPPSPDVRRKQVSDLLATAKQAANANQFALHFHQATTILDEVVATTGAEFKKYPDDRGFHEIWLQALSSAAEAREKEGEVAPPAESRGLLITSSLNFSQLIAEYTQLGSANDVEGARVGLGTAYMNAGMRSTGPEAVTYFNKAVESYEQTLRNFNKTDSPQEWAKSQHRLGYAYGLQGYNATGADSIALLNKAAETQQHALEVYSKENSPLDWAETHHILGLVYMAQAIHATTTRSVLGGLLGATIGLPGISKPTVLLDKALENMNNALEVYSRTDTPKDWAETQNDVASAYYYQAHLTLSGSKALFVRAIEGYKQCLQVYTKADLPQSWAAEQNNLGAAYSNLGSVTFGQESTGYFTEAVQSYQNSLEVYTKADLPQQWANSESNLGTTLYRQSKQAKGAKSAELLESAAQAYGHALEVYTKADLPFEWANTMKSLAAILDAQKKHADADAARKAAKEVDHK